MSILERITHGKLERPMRNLIYGVEGVGKSELCAQFPNALFICAEDGTAGIDTSRFEVNNLAELAEILVYLTKNEHDYKTINIDSVAWMSELIADFLIDEWDVDSLEQIDKGFGKWKRHTFDQFQNILRLTTVLYGQGMHINFIAHATVKKFSNPEGEDYDRYSVTVNADTIAQRLMQWADNVMFLNYETKVVAADKKKDGMGAKAKAKSLKRRFVYCERNAAYDAKSRMGFPEKFELTPTPEDGFETLFQHYNNWLKTTTTTQE